MGSPRPPRKRFSHEAVDVNNRVAKVTQCHLGPSSIYLNLNVIGEQVPVWYRCSVRVTGEKGGAPPGSADLAAARLGILHLKVLYVRSH